MKQDVVLQDQRLCATLKSNGYVYSPADEDNERWLVTQECRESITSQSGPITAYVCLKKRINERRDPSSSVCMDFYVDPHSDSSSDEEVQDTEGVYSLDEEEKSFKQAQEELELDDSDQMNESDEQNDSDERIDSEEQDDPKEWNDSEDMNDPDEESELLQRKKGTKDEYFVQKKRPKKQEQVDTSNKDKGQFHGTMVTVDGHMVPKGYGYLVLPDRICCDRPVVKKKHVTFLQGDWSLVKTTASYFELNVYGQRVSCSECNLQLQGYMFPGQQQAVCDNDEHLSEMATFQIRLKKNCIVQKRHQNLIAECQEDGADMKPLLVFSNLRQMKRMMSKAIIQYSDQNEKIRESTSESDGKGLLYTKMHWYYLEQQDDAQYHIMDYYSKISDKYRKYGGFVDGKVIHQESVCKECYDGHWYFRILEDGTVRSEMSHDHEEHTAERRRQYIPNVQVLQQLLANAGQNQDVQCRQ